jgi:tRNA A37 threonylcarbamoyladenosine biosynthesis protein TsaE
MVRDTPPYGHAPTYEISLTYLERQKSYGLDKLRWEEAEEAEEAEAEEAEAEEKIRLKQYVSLRSKGRHN